MTPNLFGFMCGHSSAAAAKCVRVCSSAGMERDHTHILTDGYFFRPVNVLASSIFQHCSDDCWLLLGMPLLCLPSSRYTQTHTLNTIHSPWSWYIKCFWRLAAAHWLRHARFDSWETRGPIMESDMIACRTSCSAERRIACMTHTHTRPLLLSSRRVDGDCDGERVYSRFQHVWNSVMKSPRAMLRQDHQQE